MLLRRRAAVYGVALGSFAVNLWFYHNVVNAGALGAGCALVIAAASTLQAVLAARWLHKRLNTKEIVGHPRDAVLFMVIATICCTIAPTVGVFTNCLSGYVPWQAFAYSWITWWAGDIGGVLVYTPVFLTWRRWPSFFLDTKHKLEFALFLVTLCLACHSLLGTSPFAHNHYPLAHALFPFLLWGAGRFGICGVTIMIPIVELFSILGLQHGSGPFVFDNQNKSLLLLAAFMATLSFVGLTFACVLTQWKSYQLRLENAAQELEDKVATRTAELEHANQQLQVARDLAVEASNIKSAFVANISHELSTPLSGILGLNELLLEQENDSETQSLLNSMYQSGQALLQVVNDVLDISKIEAGKVKLDYEPFNPVFLVQDCAKLLTPTASCKGLAFEVSLDQHLPPFVYGDQARLRQVLLNLISNAIKFTENGRVAVRVAVDRQDERTAILEFAVTDTGIGIAQHEKEVLFLPFSQVDGSSTRRFGGTGLGLAISKRFVHLMNGEIGVDSNKGTGSRFWFKVPFDKKSVIGANPAPTGTGARLLIEPIAASLACARKVLLVEDNVVLSELTLRQLSRLGIEGTCVGTGKEAIDKAVSGKFSVILMDINLPDLSGYESTVAIRSIEQRAKSTPATIIAMTAGAMEGDREKALACGMNDYLAKPVSTEQLKATLERWLVRMEAVEAKSSE